MRSNNLQRHLLTCVKGPVCPICLKPVEGDMKEHIKNCLQKKYPCRVCGQEFLHWGKRAAHEKQCRKPTSASNRIAKKFPGERTAIGGLFSIVPVSSNIDTIDYEGELQADVGRIKEILEAKLETRLKYYISMTLTLQKLLNVEETKTVNFHSRTTILFQGTNIEETIREQIPIIANKIEDYIKDGSGWVIKQIHDISLWITKL